MITAQSLAARYQAAHNEMRNVDGLQPQEALDELLKYVLFKEHDEHSEAPVSLIHGLAPTREIEAVAKAIRERFLNALNSRIAPTKWRDEGFALSDLALAKVHDVFQGLKLTKTGLDLRSSALREFLSGPVRKGLGIFLTPEEVVREVVEVINPLPSEKVLDPACGSGTFLMDAALHIFRNGSADVATIYGVDKNPRMIQLAEFNCGHIPEIHFNRTTADALLSFGSDSLPEWYKPGSFDVILTNPPFGVTVDERAYAFDEYTTCVTASGGVLKRQGSEIVFLERAIQLLKPGGRLGIVLPRSVVTNQRVADARARLGSIAAVKGVITLPPETFAATGTQTTTVILLIEKYGQQLSPDSIVTPALARIENVGFDLTGRPRAGSQLPSLGSSLTKAMATGADVGLVRVLNPTKAQESFALLNQMLGGGASASVTDTRRLSDLIEVAITGATPARSAYADSGLFLVKVGNLSGAGINWEARDRNYVSEEASSRFSKPQRQLRSGDILLTSSAHSSKYIGKKMDIVTHIPAQVGGKASFVGEVMLVRPKSNINPFLLLAYLRSVNVVQALQDRVRGQTAHLHPSDLLELPIDEVILKSEEILQIAELQRREASLNDELNELAFEQARLRRQLGEKSGLVEMLAE